ncbi:hypothetical protein TSAR_014360 [Trichomalopsis sarcophagae]|uniref:Uncharacterized protein n=1 Tax=Trichomalopsis sarcophagae TaxID=543379 RepID=A0A232EDF5_9HYME|nr:hypothetical protein TSAR_014360 [Trichomalopsis sarcophagae]
MYGMSQSGDVRVACAVNIKNDGQQYSVRLAEKLSLSPGTYTKKYTAQKDLYSKKKYLNTLTLTFKKRRLFLRKRKTELRQKKELSEGPTYESDIVKRLTKKPVTGLRYDDENLTIHGNVLETVPLSEAMIAFYEFLYLFQKKCVLTAHNCNFDYPRLLKAIKTTLMDK